MKIISELCMLLVLFMYSQSEETNSTADFIAVPGKPDKIQIQNVTDTSAHITWTKPVSKVNITNYELVANVIHTYSNESLYPQTWTFSNNIFRSEITLLHPSTKYNISIRALSKNGPGIENFATFETQVGEPNEVPPVHILSRDGSTATIRVPSVQNNNGPVSFYRVVVMNMNQMQVFQPELLRPYDQATSDGLSYYITADIRPENIHKMFVVGDRLRYNGFYNAPLDPNSEYLIFAGLVSNLNGRTKIRYPDMATKRSIFENTSNSSNDLVIGLGVAVAVATILLIIGVILLVLVRRRFHRTRRQRLSDNQELCIQGPMIQVANHGYIPEEDMDTVNYYDFLKNTIWSIPRDNLQVDTAADGDIFLGFGTFGHVVRGTVQRPNEREFTPVACYIVADGDLSPQKKRLMLRQLDILIKAGIHENITALIGTHETPENVYTVFEFSPINLKDLLLKDRHETHFNNKFTNISEEAMLDILIGIANGMNHLSQRNLIHERLCARNILMFDGVPKITGHGLSNYNRSNFALDFTRWTAQEVLSGKDFSIKSDIWSYGVLMWEACCIGGTPYNRLDTKLYVHQVCRGVRLPKLPWISEEFFQIMIGCWQTDPGERPPFFEISQQLSYFKETLSMYSHLNFDMTLGFVYELCDPEMEVAGEELCQRSVT